MSHEMSHEMSTHAVIYCLEKDSRLIFAIMSRYFPSSGLVADYTNNEKEYNSVNAEADDMIPADLGAKLDKTGRVPGAGECLFVFGSVFWFRVIALWDWGVIGQCNWTLSDSLQSPGLALSSIPSSVPTNHHNTLTMTHLSISIIHTHTAGDVKYIFYTKSGPGPILQPIEEAVLDTTTGLPIDVSHKHKRMKIS